MGHVSVKVLPTLEAMAEVYRLPTTGGPTSPRFKRYVEVMREDGVPAAGYNPMTSKPVLETVEALITTGAEATIADAAAWCVSQLGIEGDVVLFLTVSTPGIWTDRIATEVDHRLAPTNWSGGPASVLLWTGEDTSVEAVRGETIAQTVRLAWMMRHAVAPLTVADAVRQEGLAYALAGDDGERSVAVADALDVVGGDDALATKAALLYGDDVAKTMGYLPLGLPDRAGYAHAIAIANEALRDRPPADLLRRND